MIKSVPTVGRLATMVIFALCSFGAMLYLWTAFGGPTPFTPKAYRFGVLFPEATQLANQADVRIAGVPVGKVVDLEPAGNRTRATIEMERRYAPMPRDTRAILRVKTLLGETYVELSPGNPSSGRVPEDGTLPAGAVSNTVEIDEILRTFDEPTRKAWQTWMQSQAAALEGRGADISNFFGTLPLFVEQTNDILPMLDAQSSAVRKTISSTGQVFDALSEQDGELSGLIQATNNVFSTTAARDRELQAIFEKFPRFERESIRTLPELTRFGRAADPAVRQLMPAADEMSATFASLERLSPEFQAFFAQLGSVVAASRAGAPAFERILRGLPRVLDRFQPWLRNVNPMFEYIGRFRPELTAFFANVTGASLGRNVQDVLPGARGAVNYVRTAQTLSPEALTVYPRALGSGRQNAYPAPGTLSQLATGLPSLTTTSCNNGDPAAPERAIPESAVPYVKRFVYRTPNADRNVARPPCKAQGPFPGFGTTYPQLRAEP